MKFVKRINIWACADTKIGSVYFQEWKNFLKFTQSLCQRQCVLARSYKRLRSGRERERGGVDVCYFILMLVQHFDDSITRTHTNRKYTSLQIQYTYKEALLTLTDISEDWREHAFQNISSAMWAIHKVSILKCMPGQAFLRDCWMCAFMRVIYVSILWGERGNICVCEGGIRCYSHPFLAISFEWQAVNSHWSWKGKCKHMLTHSYFHRQTEWPHNHIPYLVIV